MFLVTVLISSFIIFTSSEAKSGVCRPTGPSDTAPWVYYVGKCYAPIMVRESVNFNEAANICTQLYGPRSNLASVADEEVAGFLVSDEFISDRRSFRKMMIGLRFSRGQGRWADNSYYGPNSQSFHRFMSGVDPTSSSAASTHSDLCTVVSFDPALSSNPNKNGRWSLVECSSKLQQPIIACARIADESDECAPGSHFKSNGIGCVPCPSGTYQPMTSRTTCEPCSPPREGYIIDTEGPGATSQLQCHRPLPVLTSIDPSDGLQAGSTMVKLEGTNFIIDSNLTVGFGDAVATIVASDPTYIICQSPPYTMMSTIPSRTNGVTVPVEIRFSNGVTRSTSFIYRPNPAVDRFEPTTFVISGGQNVAVRGSDFDAAQTHGLVLQVTYRGSPYTVLRSHCTLESPMLLLCKTPDLSTLLPKATSTIARQRRQALLPKKAECLSPFNARDWSFRFIFVFEQTYQTSAEADVPVAIFEDPLVTRWHEDVAVSAYGDPISITGSRLTCGIRANDVSVMVADRVCDIRKITAEEIVCVPPRQISPNRVREPVMVQIGSHIAMGVGYVKYAYSNVPTYLPTSVPVTTTVSTTYHDETARLTTSTRRVRVTLTTSTLPTTTTPIWRRRITAPPRYTSSKATKGTMQTTPSTTTTTTEPPTTTTKRTTMTTPVVAFVAPNFIPDSEIDELREIEIEAITQTTQPPTTLRKSGSTAKNPYFVTIFWGPNGPPSNTPDMEKELMPIIEQGRMVSITTPPTIFHKLKAIPPVEPLPVWKPAPARNFLNNQLYAGGMDTRGKTTTEPSRNDWSGIDDDDGLQHYVKIERLPEQKKTTQQISYNWPTPEPRRINYQPPKYEQDLEELRPPIRPSSNHVKNSHINRGDPVTEEIILWPSQPLQPSTSTMAPKPMPPSTQPPLEPLQQQEIVYQTKQPILQTTQQPSYQSNNNNNLNVLQRSSILRSSVVVGDGKQQQSTLTTTEGLTGSNSAESFTMSSAILIAIVAGATLIMLMVIVITAVIVSSRARRGRQRSWRKGRPNERDPRNTTSTRSLHSSDSVSTITFRGGLGGGGNSGSGLSEHGTMVIENGHVLSGGAGSPSTRANLAAAVATIDRLPLVLHNKINDMLIHAKRIKVTNTLVRGQYGDICLGKLWPTNATTPHDTITVTIKTLNRFVMDLDSTSLIEAFLSDALMLKGFYHRNVSAPYAIAFSGQRPLVIYPFYENGSLKSYITNKNKEILVFQLLDFASQIATAMVYLSAQSFIHKDLATRNCVVTPDFEVKVADNALVKDVYGREYVYVEQARDFLPVRWMAPESLTDLQFSLKSDIWSFGVLIWELLTRGRLPHSQIHNSEIVAFLQQQVQQHTLGGTRPVMRLPRPSNVPPELCDIVDKCCQLEPSRRPTFGWLQERLTTLLDQRHMMPAYNVPIMPVEGGNSPTTGT